MLISANTYNRDSQEVAVAKRFEFYENVRIYDTGSDSYVRLTAGEISKLAIEQGCANPANNCFLAVSGIIRDSQESYFYMQNVTKYHLMLLQCLEYYGLYTFKYHQGTAYVHKLVDMKYLVVRDIMIDAWSCFSLENCMLMLSNSNVFLLNYIMTMMQHRGIPKDIKIPISYGLRTKLICINVNVDAVKLLFSKMMLSCTPSEKILLSVKPEDIGCEKVFWGNDIENYGAVIW